MLIPASLDRSSTYHLFEGSERRTLRILLDLGENTDFERRLTVKGLGLPLLSINTFLKDRKALPARSMQPMPVSLHICLLAPLR